MKKAFDWLTKNNISYAFHNYKESNIDEETILIWFKYFSIEQVLNMKGTTWRKLPDNEKAINTQEQVISLMKQYPSLIKRPILHYNEGILLGFNTEKWDNSNII